VLWSSSFGTVKKWLPKKISIRIIGLPTDFFLQQPLLKICKAPFMFDTEGYNPGLSPDIYKY
jgi:hypothetical protein